LTMAPVRLPAWAASSNVRNDSAPVSGPGVQRRLMQPVKTMQRAGTVAQAESPRSPGCA